MITIITATYNRAATLPRAIESVLAQTYSDWELVVVDDGSTDTTAEVLSRCTDPRIRVIRHLANRGVTAAKNTGFDHIRGDWFTLLDSDDEMVPDALSTMASTAERTGATAVTCKAIDGGTGSLIGSGITEDGWADVATIARCRGDHWGITRTDLLGDMRFDERHRCLDAVWLRICTKARRYYIHRGLLIVHTEGSDRVTVRRQSIGAKLRAFRALGEEQQYLDILREVNPAHYRHLRTRVLVSNLLTWPRKPDAPRASR